MKVGIDAIHYHVPKTYLPIRDLAEARGIAYAKLNKGLGLEAMAVPDIDEDVATMAAQAVLRLFSDQKIDPQTVGRIYLGTESALDAAKATASYSAAIIEQQLAGQYGPQPLKNCDVVDLTFACIGAIDALENALDYVRADEQRVAIVVAADLAKYDLASGGEYTQGAGAVAVLVKANPRIVTFNPAIGVAMKSVSDFFKPKRTFAKTELLQQAATLLGQSITPEDAQHLIDSTDHNFWNGDAAQVALHREEPVFDGPYSNTCYQERITEALEHFQAKAPTDVLDHWDKLIFHLPYAFQGRRMIVTNWMHWMQQGKRKGELEAAIQSMELTGLAEKEVAKALSKSDLYKAFVHAYIEQGERASSLIGNMYTASIFMSFLSMLVSAAQENEDLHEKKVGFFAYGSGSKAKVLEATVQPHWAESIKGIRLFEELQARTAITFDQYEAWHKGMLEQPFIEKQSPRIQEIGQAGETLGYRYYR